MGERLCGSGSGRYMCMVTQLVAGFRDGWGLRYAVAGELWTLLSQDFFAHAMVATPRHGLELSTADI